LFKALSGSVFIVEAINASGQLVGQGSAVAVKTDELITNRHVIEHASAVRIRKGERLWPSTIVGIDGKHDLCRLHVDGLEARSVFVRYSNSLEVGETVYAIGAPEGLELTLSEGSISGLRQYGDASVIQTTAAISPGSSGGGLFDRQGRLVGITSFLIRGGQNLNFALPGEWISGLGFTLNPNTADDAFYEAFLWFELAQKATEVGKDEDAARAFREAIRLMPSDEPARQPLALAWNNLGLAHHRMGLSGDAVKEIKRAITIQPDYSEAWYNLGIVHGHLQEYSEAESDYRRCLQLNSQDAEAWNNLGATYLMTGNTKEAIVALEAATHLRPDRTQSWRALAAAYTAVGDREKADEASKKFQSLNVTK
jgi:tetratricopeptide (TPR) repeat protein